MSYVNHVVGPMKILDSVALESGGPGALIISQVEGTAFNVGSETNYKSTGGQVYRTFAGLMGQMPKFSGTTEAIAQFLTACGCEGFICSTGVELYNQLVDVATGKRAGASSHEKFAFVKCLIVPRTLSVSHKKIAKITFDIFGVSSDGTTHPCAQSSGVSLPTIAGVTEQFTLGPVKLLGTAYEGVQDVTIDFGLSEVLKSGGPDVFTKLAYLRGIEPKITIKSDDSAVLAALTILGTAQVTTASVIYLVKCNANAVRVANATAQHISFTVNGGLWLPSEKSASHPGEAVTDFGIEPIYDGTHAPLVLSAATAIS